MKLLNNSESIPNALDKHLRVAFEEYGKFLGFDDLFKKMDAVWKQYRKYGIE